MLCVVEEAAVSSTYGLVVNGASIAAWACKDLGHGPIAGKPPLGPKTEGRYRRGRANTEDMDNLRRTESEDGVVVVNTSGTVQETSI